MGKRSSSFQFRAGRASRAAVGGQAPASVRPLVTPEAVQSAKAEGKGDICPCCGWFVALGPGRIFVPHRYATGHGRKTKCQGAGRYSPMPWPPTFPGLETPDFLLAENARGTFPPPLPEEAPIFEAPGLATPTWRTGRGHRRGAE